MFHHVVLPDHPISSGRGEVNLVGPTPQSNPGRHTSLHSLSAKDRKWLASWGLAGNGWGLRKYHGNLQGIYWEYGVFS